MVARLRPTLSQVCLKLRNRSAIRKLLIWSSLTQANQEPGGLIRTLLLLQCASYISAMIKGVTRVTFLPDQVKQPSCRIAPSNIIRAFVEVRLKLTQLFVLLFPPTFDQRANGIQILWARLRVDPASPQLVVHGIM